MELIYKIWDTHRRILSRFRDQMEPARIKTKSHRQQVVGGENKKLKEINVGAGLNNSEYLFSPSFAQKIQMLLQSTDRRRPTPTYKM